MVGAYGYVTELQLLKRVVLRGTSGLSVLDETFQGGGTRALNLHCGERTDPPCLMRCMEGVSRDVDEADMTYNSMYTIRKLTPTKQVAGSMAATATSCPSVKFTQVPASQYTMSTFEFGALYRQSAWKYGKRGGGWGGHRSAASKAGGRAGRAVMCEDS